MDIFDLLLAPFYLAIVLFLAYKYKVKHEHENVAYKYFLPGLIAKIVGAICLGLVYFYYYGGGDTVNYYYTANAFVDVFFNSPSDFIHLYFGSPSISEYYLLKSDNYFVYWINDPYAFFVSKCFFPIALIGSKSYIAMAIIVASICFMSVWKMYLVFIHEFPVLSKEFAYSILFVPSVIFWGSGLMKDSITFSAVCMYVYGFYWFSIRKNYKLRFILYLIVGSLLLLAIKPYIVFALLPGSVVWYVSLKVVNIKNQLVKALIAPLIIAISSFLTFTIMNNLGDSLGKYSIEKVFDTAHGAQQDLKQSYYKGNSFDIGDYDPSLPGLISVSHKAIFATLFRPTLLDVRNVIMFFSAIENTILLIFCIYLLVKLRIYRFFIVLRSHPLAMFSFIFAIFFALSVGVSISNFGTLVRLKIPCIPFFVSSLIIVDHLMKNKLVLRNQ